jgi:hypothetical protein
MIQKPVVLRLNPLYVLLLVHAFAFASCPWAKANNTNVGSYTEKLKLVNAVTHQDITAISINSDQDITLMVLGVLSTDPDTSDWIDVTGLWTLTPDVFGSSFPLPSYNAGQWHFSPGKPGGPANLTVSTGSGATLTTVTIPVMVTPAPPDTISFQIITPPDSIFAGIPFRAVVGIYNKDGLVPGQYCFPATSGTSAIYQDSLGKGLTPDPTVTTTGGSGTINTAPDQTSHVAECFSNGLDTISITLYRAPFHNTTDLIDTTHQLVVILGSHSATTGPFRLLPAPVYKLQLQNSAGVHLTGIDTLVYPSGSIMIYPVMLDLYGNKREGMVNSNWSVTGTLHQPSQTIGVSHVYYDASQVSGDESGFIIARTLRSSALNDSTADSVGIFIKGPPHDPAARQSIAHAAPIVTTVQSSRGFFIAYDGYSPGEVTARIYSTDGQLLHAVPGAQRSNGTILWNYDDRFGRPVTNGCYIIRIFAGSRMFKQRIVLSR